MLKTTHPLSASEKTLLVSGYVCIERIADVQTWIDLLLGGKPITYKKGRGSKKAFFTRGRKFKSPEAVITASRSSELTEIP